MMRNFFLPLFLIISSISLFADTIYYEATKFGMPIREISSGQAEEFEYVLIYQSTDNSVVRQLLQDGNEIKKWEREIKFKGTYNEKEFDNGILSSIIFVESDLLVKEDIYFDGELSESRYYSYENRQLKKTTVKDTDGKELYTNSYLTASNGRLTKVVQTLVDGGESVYSFQYSDNQLQRVVAKENILTVNYLYKNGKLFSIEKLRNGESFYYKEYQLEGIDKTIEQDKDEDLYIQNFYNKKNQVTQKISWSKGDKTITHYSYDKEGNLIKETIRGKGINDRYEYYYEGDFLAKRKFYSFDELIKEATYSGKKDYIEIVYKNGVPTFETTYVDNIKTTIKFLPLASPMEKKNFFEDEMTNAESELDQNLKELGRNEKE